MTGLRSSIVIGLVLFQTCLGTVNPLFDDSRVHEIRIRFDSQDWYDQLYNGHVLDPQDPYFRCSITVDGLTLTPVGIRFKGDASFYIPSIKKPFKVDFDVFDNALDLYGMRKLNLNNMYNDPSMLREKLFLDLAGRYIPAARAVHTRLYINDQYWGLYLAVEQIDKAFVQNRFGQQEDGNLFEALGPDTDGASGQAGSDLTWLGSDPCAYWPYYRLVTNETANDYSDLVHLIDVLNNTPLAELPGTIGQVLDVENALWAVAINNLFVNLDSYNGTATNYYLYHRDDTGRFIHLHWATDEAFARTRPYVASGQDPRLLEPFWLPVTQPSERPQYRPLMERLWAVPTYRQMYLRMLARMLREGFDPDSIRQRVNRLADLIRQDVYNDANKLYSNAEFDRNITQDLTINNRVIYGLVDFVAARSAYMDKALDAYASSSDIQFNELVAVNVAGAVDQQGEHDPWLEIVNLGPGKVNLSGLYLTDNQASPKKWRMPDVVIQDGQFQVIWLDGQPGQGQTHASFRPSSGPGQLFLYDSNGVLVDTIAYPAMANDQAWGRYPDGTGTWRVMDGPTPGAANNWTYKPPKLYINEVMADNTRTIQDPDEPGAYEDWIEIYNAEDIEVDMSGMILTDNPDDPMEGWRIPAGVKIQAKGYLLFWADNDLAQGPTHTDFKLSKSGEAVALFDTADHGYVLIDQVTFGPQSSDVSYGRRGDGGSQWRFMTTPTPGRKNPF